MTIILLASTENQGTTPPCYAGHHLTQVSVARWHINTVRCRGRPGRVCVRPGHNTQVRGVARVTPVTLGGVELFPPPTLRERRHRGLARRRVAVRRRAVVFVVLEGERPHPGPPYRDCRRLHDATDHDALGEHTNRRRSTRRMGGLPRRA
jgi:hypothetical protein